MKNISLTERLAQAEASETGEAFNSFMHTAARSALTKVKAMLFFALFWLPFLDAWNLNI